MTINKDKQDKGGRKIAFDIQKDDWRVIADWTDNPAIITFRHKNKVVKKIEYPAYKVFNIAAHLDEIIEDFERGMAVASSTGFGGAVSYKDHGK